MLSAGDCPASVTGEEAEHARRRSETRKSQKQSVLDPGLRCWDRSELFNRSSNAGGLEDWNKGGLFISANPTA